MTQTDFGLRFPFLLITDEHGSAEVARQVLHSLSDPLADAGQPACPLDVFTVRSEAGQPETQVEEEQAIASAVPVEFASLPYAALAASGSGARRAFIPTVRLPAVPRAKIPQALFQSHLRVPPLLDLPTSRPFGQRHLVQKLLDYIHTTQPGLIGIGWQDASSKPPSDPATSTPAAPARSPVISASICQRVAQSASCPVLITRNSAAAQPATSWKHLLLVVNGGTATQQAIAIAHQLLPLGVERITLLYVQSPLNTRHLYGSFATPTLSWQLSQALHQAQQEKSEQIVQQAASAFQDSHVAIQTLIQTGEPGALICQTAAAEQADVIIMGDTPDRWVLSWKNRLPTLQRRPLNMASSYLIQRVIRQAPCVLLLCQHRHLQTSPSDSLRLQQASQPEVRFS